MERYYKQGSWNAICDVCGFEFKAEQLQKTWKGLYVCPKDFETRHPLDALRVRVQSNIPWTQVEGEDSFSSSVCYPDGLSGYSGFAVAGCMTAGDDTNTVAYLTSLQ